MTGHIVCLAGPTDRYAVDAGHDDAVLRVPFDCPGDPDAPLTSIPDVLATHGVAPAPAAHDLLRASIGAYTGDVRISRREAYDGWTRDLVLHLPVSEPAGWANGAAILERLLAFLTGDHWTVLIRPEPEGYRPVPGQVQQPAVRLETETVSLFSGGLDSYIGAIDALAGGGQVALVGHHAAGQGPTSTAQRSALGALRATYPAGRTPVLRFWLSPPKGLIRASETTTRGRSVLFLALGVAVASGLGPARLLVPENGFISLNVPLTPPRSGSFSTRTTHPHLIALLRDLLNELQLRVALDLPYRFRTKGEMMIDCADQIALAGGLGATMSCAHPGAGRFVPGGSPNQHCGYCVPCLIRRAAVSTWGTDRTPYVFENLRAPLSPTRGADLRALRLALDRYSRRTPTLADVLAAGPLPGTPDDRQEYFDMFRRGLAELDGFVDSFA
jgi:hypothetical protein